MGKWVCSALAACLILQMGGKVQADSSGDARAIVDKALKAMGGSEKIGNFHAATWKNNGKNYLGPGGAAITYTGDMAVQLPDQLRVIIQSQFGNTKFTMTMGLNHNKGWMQFNNGTIASMDKNRVAETREELYSNWLTTIYPLNGTDFKLSPVPEIKVDDKPAVGIKVESKGHRDVKLFFDKESGLLVKSERMVKEIAQGGRPRKDTDPKPGQELLQETFFSDFKDVSGVKFPMKTRVKRDGKLTSEEEKSEWKVVDKLDDKMFGIP